MHNDLKSKINHRFYQLDVLRFIAAFAVMLFHYNLWFYNEHHKPLVDSRLFYHITFYGNQGVYLFFMISGFVILMSATKQSPKEFAAARFIRLYTIFLPLCIFSFIVGRLFLPHYNVSVSEFLINTTLVGSFFTKHQVSDVYWTLRIEVFFYVMVFLLIYFNQIRSIRKYLNWWLVISFITYFGVTYFDYFKVFSVLRYVFSTRFSFFFIAGCYFYLLKYDYKKSDLIYPALCVIGGSLATFYFPEQNRMVGALLFVVITLVFYYLIFKKSNPAGNKKIYFYLGEFTYPLYLVHDIIGVVILIQLSKYISGWLSLMIVVPAIITFTAMIYFYIERPMRKWLNARLLKRDS